MKEQYDLTKSKTIRKTILGSANKNNVLRRCQPCTPPVVACPAGFFLARLHFATESGAECILNYELRYELARSSKRLLLDSPVNYGDASCRQNFRWMPLYCSLSWSSTIYFTFYRKLNN